MPSTHSNPLLLFLHFVVALFFLAAIVGAESEAEQLPNACCYGDGMCTEANETYCKDTLEGLFIVGLTCNTTINQTAIADIIAPGIIPPEFNFPICQAGSCCDDFFDDGCEVVRTPLGCPAPRILDSFVPGGQCDNNTCSEGACCTQKDENEEGCVDGVFGGRCKDASEAGLDGTFLGEGTSCVNENGTLKEDVCKLDRPCGQECAYDSQCDSGCCFTPVKLKFRKPNVLPATPVGRCTETNWCECSNQVQRQEGGNFRDFLRCVDGCPVEKSKKRWAHKVL